MNTEILGTVNLVSKISMNKYDSMIVKAKFLSFIINPNSNGVKPNIEIMIRMIEQSVFNILVDMNIEHI